MITELEMTQSEKIRVNRFRNLAFDFQLNYNNSNDIFEQMISIMNNEVNKQIKNDMKKTISANIKYNIG